jgi:hypothetical protein
LWLTFTADPSRGVLADWLAEARQLTGQLRAHLAQFPADPRGPELVAELRAGSPRFEELWQEHDVRQFRSRRKRYRHASGELLFDYGATAAGPSLSTACTLTSSET